MVGVIYLKVTLWKDKINMKGHQISELSSWSDCRGWRRWEVALRFTHTKSWRSISTPYMSPVTLTMQCYCLQVASMLCRAEKAMPRRLWFLLPTRDCQEESKWERMEVAAAYFSNPIELLPGSPSFSEDHEHIEWDDQPPLQKIWWRWPLWPVGMEQAIHCTAKADSDNTCSTSGEERTAGEENALVEPVCSSFSLVQYCEEEATNTLAVKSQLKFCKQKVCRIRHICSRLMLGILNRSTW